MTSWSGCTTCRRRTRSTPSCRYCWGGGLRRAGLRAGVGARRMMILAHKMLYGVAQTWRKAQCTTHRTQVTMALPSLLLLQAKIEDAIRRKNIDENYEAAMEHNPEVGAGAGNRAQARERPHWGTCNQLRISCKRLTLLTSAAIIHHLNFRARRTSSKLTCCTWTWR